MTYFIFRYDFLILLIFQFFLFVFSYTKRYHNKLVLPFMKNKIPEFSIIKHCDLKYVRHKPLNKMGYGTINIENLIA